MNGEAATLAVQNELPKLPLQIRLHFQQLEAEHLGVNHQGLVSGDPGREDLVHELVGLDRLLGHGLNRVLEEVPPRLVVAPTYAVDSSLLDG
jgi:hypothetical protein